MAGKIVEKFQLEDGREVVFRYPSIEDAALMMDYINTLSKEQTFIRFQGEEITLEQETEWLTKLVKKIEEKAAVQIMGFCNSQLIAVSDIVMLEKAEKHIGGFGITIAKEFRGLGIGKKIMELAINEATKNIPHLKIIILSCFGDNDIALSLYEKMGFKEFGKLPEGLIHKYHKDDHIYMYKKVRD